MKWSPEFIGQLKTRINFVVGYFDGKKGLTLGKRFKRIMEMTHGRHRTRLQGELIDEIEALENLAAQNYADIKVEDLTERKVPDDFE